ncbi:MAG: hypothetical protein AAGA84_07630 [Pseudomonadota bacterium]
MSTMIARLKRLPEPVWVVIAIVLGLALYAASWVWLLSFETG